MNALFLLLIIVSISTQHVCKKNWGKKNPEGTLTFSAASALLATLTVTVFSEKFVFSPSIIIYAVIFAASYSLALIFSVLALKEGPLSLTCLFTQYSLIIPTFYGLIFLSEEKKNEIVDSAKKNSLFIGLFFLLISIILVNFEKKDEKKITLKWALYTFISFLGNGICSTSQKLAGSNLAKEHKSAFMISAFIIIFSSLLLFSLFFERKKALPMLKKAPAAPILCGVANGVVNTLVLILSSRMSASVMFPVIASGGIIATAALSVTVYRERLSALQKVGLFFGIASIVFLNL